MNGVEVGNRVVIENEYFAKNISNATFQYFVLRRFGGTKKRISDVNFAYAIFEDCYFRDCVFENCNFTGATFRNSNFHGSSFPDCNFNYSEFHSTRFDKSIFEVPPKFTNLKRAFARRLRVNFHNLGERELENNATDLELKSTREFLLQSWYSSDKYYRKKYVGRERAFKLVEWIGHLGLYFIWGNGESFLRLGRTFMFAVLATGFIAIVAKQTSDITNLELFFKSPFIFFGAYSDLLKGWGSAIVLFLRLTFFGLFISMLIKKWALR